MRFEQFRHIFSEQKLFDIQEVRLIFPEFDRRRLFEWQQKGYLQKIINGHYIFSGIDMDESFLMLIANRIYRHSYISLETALGHYSLIPDSVYQMRSCTTRKTISFETSVASFFYRSLAKKLFFGYVLQGSVLIASPEKALLDWLYFRHTFDKDDFYEMRFNINEYKTIVDEEKLETYLTLFQSAALRRRYKIFREALKNA